MADDAELMRQALAAVLQGESDLTTIGERDAVLREVPSAILDALDPDDHAHMLFLRDFTDRSIYFYRVLSGDVRRPVAVSGLVQ